MNHYSQNKTQKPLTAPLITTHQATAKVLAHVSYHLTLPNPNQDYSSPTLPTQILETSGVKPVAKPFAPSTGAYSVCSPLLNSTPNHNTQK